MRRSDISVLCGTSRVSEVLILPLISFIIWNLNTKHKVSCIGMVNEIHVFQCQGYSGLDFFVTSYWVLLNFISYHTPQFHSAPFLLIPTLNPCNLPPTEKKSRNLFVEAFICYSVPHNIPFSPHTFV